MTTRAIDNVRQFARLLGFDVEEADATSFFADDLFVSLYDDQILIEDPGPHLFDGPTGAVEALMALRPDEIAIQAIETRKMGKRVEEAQENEALLEDEEQLLVDEWARLREELDRLHHELL